MVKPKRMRTVVGVCTGIPYTTQPYLYAYLCNGRGRVLRATRDIASPDEMVSGDLARRHDERAYTQMW